MRYNTLSDKIGETNYDNCRIFIGHKFLLIEDVKEAVRLLKGIDMNKLVQDGMFMNHSYQDKINEIFGDKLI